MPKAPKFIFNDEKQKNSYGFTIPTKGISLKRFKKNPVMLNSHWHSTESVLGKWEDVKVVNGILSGTPLFDSDDESVTTIEGKVDRGFIKSCSMGITFNRDDLKYIAGKLILEKCELYEVSIVAVPSNANSIRLYLDDSKEAMTEQEINNLCLSVSPVDAEEININNENKNKNSNMKITLTSVAAIALGFGADELEHEDSAISLRIVKLGAEKKAAELTLSGITEAAEVVKLEAIKSKVALAVKSGKITTAKEQEFINLGIANEGLLDSTLEAIPEKKSLAAQITNAEGKDVITPDDFQKLSLEAQLSFKQTQPEAYNKLFTQKN